MRVIASGTGGQPGLPRVGAVLCGLRGGVLGLVAMLLALGGHVLAGGDPVAARELVGPAALSTGVCVLLSRRRLSFPVLFAALGGSQLGIHLWLASGAGQGTGSTATGMAPMHGGPVPMLAAHVLAALVAATLLRAGESGLWGALALLAQRLWVAVVFVVVAPTRPAPVLVDHRPVALWAARLVGSAHARRGPPVGSAS